MKTKEIRMHIQKRYKLIVGLLISIIVFQYLLQVFQIRQDIFQKFETKIWEEKYYKSQWVIPYSKHEISDEDLFTFIGDKVIHGHDPSLLNGEVPPLGKYSIGLFLLTGYVGIYGLFFSALSLILFYWLNTMVFKNRLLALIPVVLFAFDPIFKEQVGQNMLDAQYLSWLLLTFIFLLKKRYIVAGIFAGFFMATKSPFVIVVLFVALISYLIVSKRFSFTKTVIMGFATGCAYLACHIPMFFHGHGILGILKLQKYIYSFYRSGAQGTFGAVIPLLFSGYWLTWFDKDGFIKQWTILWPASALMTLASMISILRSKDFSHPVVLLSLWLIFYMAFLMLVPVFPRYLLLALPFMYNLSVWGIWRLAQNYLSQRS